MNRTAYRLLERARHRRAALALFLVVTLGIVTLGACGNLTAGGLGEATVVISGDAPDQTTQAQAARTVLPAPLLQSGDEPEGEVEVELAVFLVAEGGDLVPITDGEVRVRVDLEGVEEPEIGSRQVTAATYTGLRMIFVEVEAEVDTGLIIGGLPVTNPIDVEIEDPLEVTKPLSLDIEDGSAVELLIDLNAESWLLAVDPETLTVDAQIFADLVSVVVR